MRQKEVVSLRDSWVVHYMSLGGLWLSSELNRETIENLNKNIA